MAVDLEDFIASRDAAISEMQRISRRPGEIAEETLKITEQALEESRRQSEFAKEANAKAERSLRVSMAALVVAIVGAFIAVVVGVAQIAFA